MLKDLDFQLSQLEHILKRPDSYIGSVEHLNAHLWVFDRETKGMTQKNISYVPGFFKIFDEILVNAADNKVSIRDSLGDRTFGVPKTNIASLCRSMTPPWTASK